MKPLLHESRIGPALWVLVVVHLVWRFVCFVWQPLNLQSMPGALFESSAVAATGLLVVWVVLGPGRIWWRAVGGVAVYVALRFLQDAGVALHSWRVNIGNVEREVEIFRLAEDEVLSCCLILSVALRWLLAWRITAADSATSGEPLRMQFKLGHLFILTSVVAVLIALARNEWIQSSSGWDAAIHRIIFLHSVTISLAIFPAFVVLLPRPRWAIAAMLIAWLLVPFITAAYFILAGWFGDWHLETVIYLAYIVVGAGTTALASALAARWSGLQLRIVNSAPKRPLPKSIALPDTFPSV